MAAGAWSSCPAAPASDVTLAKQAPVSVSTALSLLVMIRMIYFDYSTPDRQAGPPHARYGAKEEMLKVTSSLVNLPLGRAPV